jgi:hypothetical protein
LKLPVASACEALEALVHPISVRDAEPEDNPSLEIGAPDPPRVPERRELRRVEFEERAVMRFGAGVE